MLVLDIECHRGNRKRRSAWYAGGDSRTQLDIAADTPVRDDFRETWFFDLLEIR